MPVIYLKHPQHGAKVAISHAEAENDALNGWVEFDPTEVAASDPAPAPVEAAAVVEEAAAPVNQLQPRRRGRPPRELQ